jgi:hypothetical protein
VSRRKLSNTYEHYLGATFIIEGLGILFDAIGILLGGAALLIGALSGAAAAEAALLVGLFSSAYLLLGVATNVYGGIYGYLAYKFNINMGYSYDTEFWSSRQGLEQQRQSIHFWVGGISQIQQFSIGNVQSVLEKAASMGRDSSNPVLQRIGQLFSQASYDLEILNANYGDYLGYADTAIDEEEYVLGV